LNNCPSFAYSTVARISWCAGTLLDWAGALPGLVGHLSRRALVGKNLTKSRKHALPHAPRALSVTPESRCLRGVARHPGGSSMSAHDPRPPLPTSPNEAHHQELAAAADLPCQRAPARSECWGVSAAGPRPNPVERVLNFRPTARHPSPPPPNPQPPSPSRPPPQSRAHTRRRFPGGSGVNCGMSLAAPHQASPAVQDNAAASRSEGTPADHCRLAASLTVLRVVDSLHP
jgi:hypothetical protein